MRLFIALLPDDALRKRLGALSESLEADCGGRRIADANIHLTLAFLGEQDATTSARLRQFVEHYPPVNGRLVLDTLGVFTAPGIVWIGPGQPPQNLLLQQAALSRQLADMGLAHRPSHFRPHVSLRRRAMAPAAQALSVDKFCWSYTSIHLIQSSLSHEGSHYTLLASSKA
ncbi:RNA 2',3'-cyclic phosphodiesterase [Halomonas denitrificans]|uniref:RNA 2',3'-cyclic phosphodiesterase n=1 Tax=Halomonas TaxID=2745 RepID=UPI001C95CA44|nr:MULTISPECIES: RNA 2',3'-cyclic phosphodiesterase [Halomonas]MBY6031148.1 RNA 2',3'-cyclic phosphodiesterase [Halomonas sp. DP8Y7-1]MBY5925041.1 RNA 2',3'-cyclic phosphodiesterase [Halomonas sp. DP4Y7-2]MBY5967958.1 RNA 2',3'-cyclic phosphodiesterase [Halomonas denitrificans]MBY6232082.1 RNA 2',3'-cyclic phosphodiesterase [Halomonas sp. DP4Y7-1]MCA0974210.1 RNA 2',3'-cyclic phosphodiesterase [Halomonas denitrificans]